MSSIQHCSGEGECWTKAEVYQRSLGGWTGIVEQHCSSSYLLCLLFLPEKANQHYYSRAAEDALQEQKPMDSFRTETAASSLASDYAGMSRQHVKNKKG